MDNLNIQPKPRPVESYVVPRPMNRRDWAMAMAAFASMGLPTPAPKEGK